ncbi:MAG: ATP-binding cassette domain-containing protein [Granulosicoccaceae bacterium]
MSNGDANASLSARNINFSFGRKAVLDNVQIDVPNGRFVALLGQNGAGKTTLFSIITGLYAAHGGEIRIGGHDLRKSTQAALGAIGVVFQRPTLDRDLTVRQNLRYFCNLHGISTAEAQERIDASLLSYNLSDLHQRKVTELSGGQQRRIELARSTLHDPNFLLLDEPTVGLDHANRMEFVSNVKALCKERNVGVLWATHLMDEVEDADYVYILHHGKIMFEGGSGNLLEEHGKRSIAELYSHLTKQHTDTKNR